MVGGAFLCYEGFEKLAHRLMHGKEDKAHHAEHLKAVADPEIDIVAFERDKIKGAIRTDFILSAEIIAITLGTVATQAFGTQVAVLAGIAALMTVGVYGLVAGIVKLDDGGLYLSRRAGTGTWSRTQRSFGRAILAAAPAMMKSLSVIGTAAMFLVGGGILTHGLPFAEEIIHRLALGAGTLAGIGRVLEAIMPTLLNMAVGIIAGAIVLAVVKLTTRGFNALRPRS
jgi:uncharacterized protein